jgi:hypothetical protein
MRLKKNLSSLGRCSSIVKLGLKHFVQPFTVFFLAQSVSLCALLFEWQDFCIFTARKKSRCLDSWNLIHWLVTAQVSHAALKTVSSQIALHYSIHVPCTGFNVMILFLQYYPKNVAKSKFNSKYYYCTPKN